MRQLFLCTMLIIAAEAFPEDLSRILVPKKRGRKTSGFPPQLLYPKSNHFISSNVNVPGLYVPYPYETPFLAPFDSKNGENSPLQRANSRLRPRERFSRRRKWTPTYPRDMAHPFTYVPLRYSGCSGNSDLLSSPRRDLTGFASYGPGTEYRSQYPVNFLHEIEQREPEFFKRRRLSPTERRYLNRFRCKNKRNANKETTSEEDKTVGAKHREPFKQNDDNLHKMTEASLPESAKDEAIVSKKIGGKQKVNGDSFEDSGARDSEKVGASEEGEGPVSSQKAGFKGTSDSLKSRSLKTEGGGHSKNAQDSRAGETNLNISPEVANSHITKLKEMLDQVQTLLKEDNVKKDKPKKYLGERGDENPFKNEKPTAFALKDKIDTAIPILMQISEDLMKISNITNKTTVHNEKVVVRCSADGTWTSREFGLDMTFKTLPNMMLKVTPGMKTDGMINKRWSIQGLTMSKDGGPLMLAAVCPQKRKIASFLGQCKICKENDIIFGTWTFYTFAQKFTDLWKAVEFRLDVLKKKT